LGECKCLKITACVSQQERFTGVFERYRVIIHSEKKCPHNAPCGVENRFFKEEYLISKVIHSLAAQLLGIGNYRYSEEGELYFVHGNSQIKVTEHFPDNGKTMDTLLEDLILFSANQQS